ncbi:MAG: bifunctional DNA primase/polymerase [Acidobacteriota bacterium]
MQIQGEATLLDTAMGYLHAGLSLIAIKTDGSKKTSLKTWKEYETRQPTEPELRSWFAGAPRGIALVGGKVSGGLECVDIDAPELIEDYFTLIGEHAAGLIGRLVIVETPRRGRHLVFRCSEIGRNQKLAMREVELGDITDEEAKELKAYRRKRDGKWCKLHTLLETRGEGGYFLAPGSPASCHTTGREYRLTQGSFSSIPVITKTERAILLDCARSLNEHIKDSQQKREPALNNGLKPGADFNLRGDVRGLLERHGWRKGGSNSIGERWIRPGGDRPSGTLFEGSRKFFVFSTNAAPLEYDRAYSPFALLTTLEHGNDFPAAAKALAADGYGEPARQPEVKKLSQIAQPANAALSSGQYEYEAPEPPACPYKANGVGLVWLKPINNPREGGAAIVPVQLTNFTAEIIGDVVRDDGAEQTRVFELSAKLANESTRHAGLVAAEEFDSMKWLNTILGARAVVYPSKSEHTRVAIRLLSNEIKARRVIAHTGWRDDGDGARYYHAGGAIGAEGLIEAEVELPAALASYSLPVPPDGEERADAVRAVFDLFKVAPDEVMLPLLGAVWVSVLAGADFSIYLAGKTGSGKSVLAALALAFFGQAFEFDNLPASWSSTGNSLESLAHTAKDCVLVVDDFCPAGSAADHGRLQAAADRIFRAQGNHSGRLRCRTDGTIRAVKPPRGLIVSTGEDIPHGQSLRARTLIQEVVREQLDWPAISKAQAVARQGVYAQAMAAFLLWLATKDRITQIQSKANDDLAHWREEWMKRGLSGHKRNATTLAQLARGWNCWLSFAQEVGAISQEERTGHWRRVWAALDAAGKAQDQYQASQNPAIRFIELIQAALSSGKAHLAMTDGGKPESDQLDACGWRDGEAQGDRIGWIDGEDVYLQPDSAFSLAQRLAAGGEGLSVSSQTLWKRLNEAGLLASNDTARDTLKVRRKIGGKTLPVLHFCAEKVTG